MNQSKFDLISAGLLAALVDFCVLANGAYDLWAATAVHVFVLILTLSLLILKMGGKEPEGLILPQAPFALFLGAAFFISFKRSLNPGESFIALVDWFTALQLFYLAANVLTSEKAIRIFVIGIAPLFLIQMPLLVKQNALFILRAGYQDPAGTLLNANVLTAFELLWAPILWDRLKKSFSQKQKTFWLWVLVSIAWIVNFAFARSVAGWALLLLFFPLFLGRASLEDLYRAHRKIFWTGAGVVLVSAVVLLTFKLRMIFHTGTDFFNRPYTSRVIWWKSGLLMFRDYPWFGIGLGNFPSAYLAYKTGEGVHTLHAHSFVVKFLAETGAVGFLSLLLFFLEWMRRILKSRRGFSDRAHFVVGVLLFLFFTSISIGMEYLANLAVLFIFMGLSLSEENARRWKPRRSMVVIFVALGVALVPYMVSPFIASQEVVEGESLMNEKNPEKSLPHFASAIELDSRSFEAYRDAAEAVYQRFLTTHDPKEIEAAVQKQRLALERNKLSGDLWFDLSRYLEASGKTDEAVAAAKNAVSCHKTSTKFQENVKRLTSGSQPNAG